MKIDTLNYWRNKNGFLNVLLVVRKPFKAHKSATRRYTYTFVTWSICVMKNV